MNENNHTRALLITSRLTLRKASCFMRAALVSLIERPHLYEEDCHCKNFSEINLSLFLTSENSKAIDF